MYNKSILLKYKNPLQALRVPGGSGSQILR
jgi:hypothetical protein